MKKFWKTVAFLGTAALAVTGGICLIRKFFNPDEELEDFDDDDLFEEDEDDTDEVEAFDNDAEIFEDEAKEAPAEEKSEAEPVEKKDEKEKHYFLGRKEICSGRLVKKMRLMKF